MFGNYSKDGENKNKYGDKGYQMKDVYYADELIVGNLQRLSSSITNYSSMVESTEQKYIFEIVDDGKKIKYREIFTGFIVDNQADFFDIPYVVNIALFTDYFPETIGLELSKLSLIWIQNDLNFLKKDKLNKSPKL